MKAFFAVAGGLAYLLLTPIWSGFVLSIMWGWFIAPAFHLPQINIPLAIGISLVIGMLTYQVSAQEPDKTYTKRSITVGIAYPLLLLIFAAIVHIFI